MPIRKGFLFGFAFVAVAGCATLDEDQCRSVDWVTLGTLDGREGFPTRRVLDHAKACAQYGLPVDQAAWLRGWESGIRNYCTPQRGYSEGRDGARYRDACPAEVERGFLAAYRPAKRVADAENDLRAAQDTLERTQDKLVDLAAAEDRDPEEVEALRRTLRFEQDELRRAQREESRAREALFAFLRRNPNISP